jgi:CPA2 family monovalent cation:H+ antiporter-2/glutathione-regulated potassium-efflux system ancillary protein KefC
MHFTEFGVVMMLFLVGLELKPSLLWQMRIPIIGTGGVQVILSIILIGGIALMFLPWQQAVAIGCILSLSSTALVLQTLREKGLMSTASGRSIFSVLLFQDLAVIPMLALLPLLATLAIPESGHAETLFFDISVLPGYQQFIATILAILIVFFIGKFASRPMFRAIASTRVREIFVAAALALVVGISLLMTAVGLSQALGAFLAGVVLADSEYRHELESDLEPFKGLLLGIFFISIGASLNFTLIGDNILLIAGIMVGLMLIKWLVLIVTATLFKMKSKDRLLFSIALAQGGEFAFVLFQFSRTNGILPDRIIEPMITAVAISMFLTPFLFRWYEKFSISSQEDSAPVRDSDEIAHSGHKVILAGFGRFGTDVGRFLLSAGVRPVIIDNDAANIDVLRKFGFEVYYGDITRLDLLEAAGAVEAELLIIAIADVEISRKLVELTRKHYPNLKIAVNAYDHTAVYELMDLGVSHIRRTTFGSALSLGQDALQLLGVDPYEAYRLMRIFRKKDEKSMPTLYEKYLEDEDSYISMYQQHMTELEALMAFDMEADAEELDKAWMAKNPEE